MLNYIKAQSLHNSENLVEAEGKKKDLSVADVPSSDIPYKFTPEIKIPLSYQIPDKNRRTIYLSLIILSIFSTLDLGIIPSATTEIKKDLNIKDQSLGIFGSSDYVGRIIGAFLVFSFNSRMTAKYMLITATFIKALSLCSTVFISNFYVLLIFRGFSGLSQVFFTIFLPVWCDHYGKPESKTMMIAMTQLGVPMGAVLGFILCTLLKGRWIPSFIIQGILMLIPLSVIFVFPKGNFSISKTNISIVEKDEKRVPFKNFASIMKEPIFIFTTLSNSISFFTMNTIQFWGADYMKVVLKVSESKRMIVFSTLCLTGPTVGVIIGGLLGSYIGGYENIKASFLCILLSGLGFISICPCGIVRNLYSFSISCWFFLFFVGMMNPILTGISISCVNVNIRSDASTFMNFLLNLFGNLPPPYVYSLIKVIGGDRAAMISCTNFSLLSFILLFFTVYYRKKNQNYVSDRTKTSTTVSSAEDLVMVEQGEDTISQGGDLSALLMN